MKLYVLFEQPDETYPGQYAPLAVTVLDEYTVDNSGRSLHEAQEAEIARLSTKEGFDPTDAKWVWIEVDLGVTEQLIRDAILRPALVVQGTVAAPAVPQGQKHPSYEAITVTRGRPGAGRIVDDEIVE